MHEIEYGGEVFIPNELSQDRLPCGFRYYDPILTFVQDNIDDEKRDFFLLKNQLAYLLYSKSDPIKDELEKLGICEGALTKKKIVFTRSAVNQKAPYELKHWESPHTTSLQRSKYLCIDSNISRKNIYDGALSNQFNREQGEETANPIDPTTGKPIHVERNVNGKDEVSLRFCPDHEVGKKRKRILMIKA